MFVIVQPISPAPAADSTAQVLAKWNAVYDGYTEELKSMFEKQAGVKRFDVIQTFHDYKQEEGKPVSPYVVKMKGYVEQLERLGYMLQQDLSVGLILNGLTSDFARFVRNYNMHNMGKTINKLHALLIEFEKGLPKKAATPQVMAFQGGRIQKANKKLLNAKGKGKMTRKPFPHRIKRATDLLGLIHTDVYGPLRHVSRQGASYFITFTNDYSCYSYVYLLRYKHEVFETFKVFKNKVENQLGKTTKALRSDRGGEYISQEFKYYLKDYGIVQQLTPLYTAQHIGASERRNRTLLDMVQSMTNLTTLLLSFREYALEIATCILNMIWRYEALVKRDTPDKLQQRSVKCIFIGYPKEMICYYFYFPPENKIVFERYKNLVSQKVSGRTVELEEIQDEDTSPSENTSKIPMEVEGFKLPQEEFFLICRSARTHRAPDRLCLNVKVEEYSLRDLNEPTNYKAAFLDSESGK
nr:hypothetical protein [Tanacetum cinerariifolium]